MNNFIYRIGRAEIPTTNGHIHTKYKIFIYGDENTNEWCIEHKKLGNVKILSESINRYILFRDWYDMQTMLSIVKRNGALSFGMSKRSYNRLIKNLEDNIRKIKTELGISLAEMNSIEE